MGKLERYGKKLLGINTFNTDKLKRFRGFYRKVRERAKLTFSSYPKFIGIENTTKCNSACSYCARPRMVKKRLLPVEDMSGKMFVRVVQQIRKHCSDNVLVNICGLGEPLLDPSFTWRIRYLKWYLPKVESVTNGINLKDELAEAIVKSKLDILTISLNSFDRETYKQINGVDQFDVVVTNILSFLRLKGSSNPATVIQILNIDANRARLKGFIEFWNQHLNENDKVHLKTFENAGGYVETSVYDTSNRSSIRHPCLQLWQRLIFSLEGDVYPCCLARIAPSLKIGNIMQQSLQDILNGERLWSLRWIHKHGKYNWIPECQACNIWQHCHNPFIKAGKRWW